VIVDCALYEDGKRRAGELPLDELSSLCHAKNAFVWIGLYEPTEEEFDSVRREFELHELAVEDAIHAHQRPKLEVYDGMVFIVLKTARYVDPEEVVRLAEILIFLGDDYVITVRHGETSELKEVRQRLEHQPELLAHGPGAVLHAIVENADSRAVLDQAGGQHVMQCLFMTGKTCHEKTYQKDGGRNYFAEMAAGCS
jgi:magnesium transporter